MDYGYYLQNKSHEPDYGQLIGSRDTKAYSDMKNAESLKSSEKAGGSMDPATAGMMVGGSFLSNYMQQRAAEEQAKKQNQISAINQHGQNQQDALGNLMQMYRSALIGG